PQLLDRFGLTVEVAAPSDPQRRVEVVRRRMAYDADPHGFASEYRAADQALTERIASARERVDKVFLSEAALLKIAEVCAAFEVDGLRADIVTARTAVAHAAWQFRDEVTKADIRRAALLALPHRRRRNPFDAPGLDEDLLDRILEDDVPPDPPEDTDPDDPPAPPSGGSDQSDGDDGNAPDEPGEPREPAPSDDTSEGPAEQSSSTDDAPSVVGAGAPYRPKLFKVDGMGEGAAGHRSRAQASTGRRIGASFGDSGSLHLVETLKAAAGKQHARERVGGRVALRGEDLRVAVREGREANLVLFCVDASGSMAAHKRMTQVKTAILSLLLDAYRRRDKVGLITFRGTGAEVALPPTHSVDIAAARLDELPAGGRTPLAEGLLEAHRVLRWERIRDPRLRPLLVVVTDGRATGGDDAVARSQQAAAYVAGLGATTVVVDGESGPLRLGLAITLAERLGAEHMPVAQVTAETLSSTVQSHVKGVA
ncbi:MAG TPA: VWA domain-containing protein, partial [Nocardioidaceae bacterium]|nr:VWA domain-containing protein [Nocardioidaceae bacterium]